MNARNIEKNGVLINIYFFCKAVGLPKPVGVKEPIDFMNRYIQENDLDWSEISEKVSVYREAYKQRRRASQQKKENAMKRQEEEFFKEFRKIAAKDRNCLKCDIRFFSENGDRLCGKCQQSNMNHIEEFGI